MESKDQDRGIKKLGLEVGWIYQLVYSKKRKRG